MSITCTKTDIDGLLIIEPTVFGDSRGEFFESYNLNDFQKAGINCQFVQDNQSSSVYGVIRGLHCQQGEHAQAKLVRVLEGAVLDVAVDIRPDSKTFGKYVCVELSAENKKQLFIPRGFLHGFSVLTPKVTFAYKCDNFYCKDAEYSVRFDDPTLAIDWRIPADKAILSPKDLEGHSLLELKQKLSENN